MNNKTNVKIICNTHGIFEQSPTNHINRKDGCPKCSLNKKITQDEFIEKSKKIHNNKYDYSLVDYINAKTKIKIICPEHEIFETVASSHTDQKTGCPKCSKKYSYTNNEFITKPIFLHGFLYDYSETNYVNNYTKITIKCKTHGSFLQTPSNHLSGKGCELCNTSKNENIISLFLTNKKIKFIRQHKFPDCKNKRRLPFDFYLPDYNICIEFNGKQHYEPIDFFGGKHGFILQQKRDKIKELYCINNNITLFKIKYDDNVIESLSSYFI